MFGPNTYFKDNVDINYSHRDKIFFDLLKDTREKFSRIFNLQDYDILFIPGSGTIGIEAAIYSYKGEINVVGHSGVFTNRWQQMNETYNKTKIDKDYKTDMYCLLETSASKYYQHDKSDCIVDAISAFPYYSIPKNTKCFITCLNKQLGSYIGVAIVGVRKDSWHEFIDDSVMSYLNLSRYKHYHENSQTPSTFPTYALQHFNKLLDNFNLDSFRNKLDNRCNKLVIALGKNKIIGDLQGPVLTIPKNSLDKDIQDKFEIYGYYCQDKPNYQIFTYSGLDSEYEEFEADLLKKGNKIIAVDFDDTITEPSPFPITGKLRPDAIKTIKELRRNNTLILWTCRTGKALQEAIDLLDAEGITFDYINEFPDCGSKVFADIYIDDRSWGSKINWKEIEDKLVPEEYR